MAEDESKSLQYTPTWVVAIVCFIIVLISLLAQRALHYLGKYLKRGKTADALFEALQQLKEELMLLGFISLLLAVFQRKINSICIPPDSVTQMFPCKKKDAPDGPNVSSHQAVNINNCKETSAAHCLRQDKVPLVSMEALHQLHIFIFVLAVVHVIFSATTIVLGGARIRQWKQWEDSHLDESKINKAQRKSAVMSWMISFFKQFYVSVSKSDYIALRHRFIKTHCPSNPKFNFHQYMMRTVDFKKIVGISWYLWLYVVIFLMLNVKGWHIYFWLSFLPLILLLLMGAKLEHIITRLVQEVAEKHDQEAAQVKLSDEHFWFHKPGIFLHLIHFVLFQNAFGIAFFFWIWCTYGIDSCIMERIGYIITRLFIGVVVQVLCSYSTWPLYIIVTQMGSRFKRSIFIAHLQSLNTSDGGTEGVGDSSTMPKISKESSQNVQIAEPNMVVIEATTSITELSCAPQMPMP